MHTTKSRRALLSAKSRITQTLVGKVIISPFGVRVSTVVNIPTMTFLKFIELFCNSLELSDCDSELIHKVV